MKSKLLLNLDLDIYKDHKILIAVSTGVDSMALLYQMMATFDKNNLGVVHVNHQKREQSKLEEAFITEFCEKNNLTLYKKTLEKYTGSNFQEWARNKRYAFFKEIYDKYNYDYLFLAHHADDNLENIIMKFLKSSSLSSLKGMEESSIYQGMQIVRPFIYIPKSELITYMEINNYKYYTDESNLSSDYTRNRIRNNLIPLLKEENPSIYKALNSYINHIKYSECLLKEKMAEINSYIKIYNKGYIIKVIDYNIYKNIDDYLKKEYLFTNLKSSNLSIKTIEELMRQISIKTKLINQISPHHLIIKEYGKLKIIENYQKFKDNTHIIDEDKQIEIYPNQILTIQKKDYNNTLSFPKICYNIDKLMAEEGTIIRKWHEKDHIQIKDKTISISNLLTNKKINYLDRLHTFVVEKDQIIEHILIYKQERE